jgi:hypothetical protein
VGFWSEKTGSVSTTLSGLNSTDNKGGKQKKTRLKSFGPNLEKAKENTENKCRRLTVGFNHGTLTKWRKNHGQRSKQ